MNFRSVVFAIFLGLLVCSCTQYNNNKKLFLALNKFQDSIFQSSIPQVKKYDTSEIEFSETNLSLTEEQERAVKEAEALLNEPTIAIDY